MLILIFAEVLGESKDTAKNRRSSDMIMQAYTA